MEEDLLRKFESSEQSDKSEVLRLKDELDSVNKRIKRLDRASTFIPGLLAGERLPAVVRPDVESVVNKSVDLYTYALHAEKARLQEAITGYRGSGSSPEELKLPSRRRRKEEETPKAGAKPTGKEKSPFESEEEKDDEGKHEEGPKKEAHT
jgi:hypothetical protein